jgi:hypothetical protein
MATATKKKTVAAKPTAMAKTKKEDFLQDLRVAAEKNGKALDAMGFGDILKRLEAEGEIMSASEMGGGWAVLNKQDKNRLCGVPLLILSSTLHDGEFGEFVSLQVLTNTERLIVNDGSTGIFQQVKDKLTEGDLRAIYCKHGFRRSDYTFQDPKTGEDKAASTYYLDTSA